MYTIGIDIGSLTSKIVILKNRQICASSVARSSYNFAQVGEKLLDDLLTQHDLNKDNIAQIIVTGYGRYSLPNVSTNRITEIAAHARGCHYYFPDAAFIIDIGGQDSKVIVLAPKTGKVLDFQMNDKCAAGTGRFLEVMAKALEVDLNDFGNLALSATKIEPISSVCTVFAESEVIGLFAKGIDKATIAAGIHTAIATRVASMAMRLAVQDKIVFCGGVALNPAVKKALEGELGHMLYVPPSPQLTGALGAALIAFESANER